MRRATGGWGLLLLLRRRSVGHSGVSSRSRQRWGGHGTSWIIMGT